MTYNIRFKDKLQREQKHQHRNFKSIFTHRYQLGDIDVKHIDNRKQTSMFIRYSTLLNTQHVGSLPCNIPINECSIVL